MKKKTLALALLPVLAAIIFYLVYGRHGASGEFAKLRNNNIVLITIDTLRADHLPAYGYQKIKTPNLDRFASTSLIFENAIAQAPMTLPSHASLLTGLLPVATGVHDNAGYILNERVKTLAEYFKDNGYQTAAFVSSFVLDHQFGLAQGFDYYSDSFTLSRSGVSPDNVEISRRAEETESQVDSWLQKNKRTPFFLWVHYYDPHDPYDPPEPYKTQYRTALYDGEIAYVDQVFGRFLQALERKSFSEKSVIVVAGDHGEGLGEHKERTHSLFLYRGTVHVPLLIHLPQIKPQRISGIVSLIDVAPTLLELAGIKSDQQMQGKSLLPLIKGEEQNERAAYSESMFAELHYGWSPLRSLTTGSYKFIEAPKAELYDRMTDHEEATNLIRTKKSEADQLRSRLEEIVRTNTREENNQAHDIDSETAEKFKALGYVGSTVSSTEESRKIDPKDRIGMLEEITSAHQSLKHGNYAYVTEAMNRVIREDPNIVDAHYLLSTAYLSTGRDQDALKEMMETLRLKPDHTQTLYNLAFYYQLGGNLPAAEKQYLQLLKYSPDNIRGMLNLAGMYYQMRQPEKAQPFIAKVLSSYDKALRETSVPEERAILLERQAEIYFKTGDLVRSEAVLKEAIALSPDRPTLYFHLGTIYRRTDRLNEAIRCFQRALQIRSDLPMAQFALAEAYYLTNTNLDQALKLAEAADGRMPSKEGSMLLAAIRQRLRK